ncbi:MAG: DNA polymerase III subunit gamma/tau [bacterium]|nr:DNA polymerase III subunit gamma/tau [bacterium]
MAYISLYRKYRPKKFSEVVGQDVIIKIIKNSIKSNKINHAYIFSGPRGTGKTTIAKIFARAVNCLNFKDDICGECDNCKNKNNNEIDIIEIDAASNNGVDEIREIRNSVKYLPSSLKYKVYIVDEVHMLSSSAFNALLKTLEEPPSHVIFILATTEFNKIPATVVSRCQKFDFKKINNKTIIERLKYILKEENKNINEDVLNLIAKLSDGGLRDSINLLDQILSINEENVTTDQVYNLIGELSDIEVSKLLETITKGDVKELLNNINKYINEGKNLISIVNKLEILIRNILIYNSTDNYFDIEYENILSKFNKIDINKIFELSKNLFELNNELKKTNNQKILIEIYFLKATLLFTNQLNYKTKVCQNNEDISENVNNNAEFNCNNLLSNNDKKININNALSGANKELKNEFINKFKIVEEYVSSKDYNSISNLLLKSIPEVVSDKNILFTFKNNFEVVLFDKNIEDIQKFINMLYNKKYVVVAVSSEQWIDIRNEYIKNIKAGVKYQYIEERPKQKKATKNTVLQDSVEDIFGNDYTTI